MTKKSPWPLDQRLLDAMAREFDAEFLAATDRLCQLLAPVVMAMRATGATPKEIAVALRCIADRVDEQGKRRRID